MPDLRVLATEHWDAFVMPDQRYLGRLVVVLNRECDDLAYVTEAEFLAFRRVVQVLESAMRKAFDATMFNWCCLMNNAYQETAPNPQVHWHFRPRYNHPVVWDGVEYTDPNFGHHYLREDSQKLILPQDVLERLANKIRLNVLTLLA